MKKSPFFYVIGAWCLTAVVSCSSDPVPSQEQAPDPSVGHAEARVNEALAYDPDLTHYVSVPYRGGALAHQSCVHEVPEGSTISANGEVTKDGKVINILPKCSYATLTPTSIRPITNTYPTYTHPNWSGFIEGAGEYAPTNNWGTNWFQSLQARFVVPPVPSTFNGQVLYFHIDLVSYTIPGLTPTLQFGTTAAGGSATGWSIASWASDVSFGYIYTSALAVNPGDQLSLSAYFDPSACNTSGLNCLYYASISGPAGARTIGHVMSGPMNWAYTSMFEAYGITACTDYPASGGIQFTNVIGWVPDTLVVNSKVSTAPWTTNSSTQTINCGFGIQLTYASGQSYPSGSTISY